MPHTIDGNSAFCFHKNIIIVYATRSEPASIIASSCAHIRTYMYIMSCVASNVLLGYFLTITSVARMYLSKFSVLISSVNVPSPSLCVWPVICLPKSMKNIKNAYFSRTIRYYTIYDKNNSTCNIVQTMFAIFLFFFLRLKLYCFSDRFERNTHCQIFRTSLNLKKNLNFYIK